MAKVYDAATDLITFARSSSGTALRRVGYGDDISVPLDQWVKVGDAATTLTYNAGDGSLEVDAATTLDGAAANLPGLEVGKVYVFEANFTLGTSGDFRLTVAPSYTNFVRRQTSGTVQLVFTAQHAAVRIDSYTGTGTFTINSVSVKEVIFDRATDDLVLFNHPDDIPRIEYAADGSLKGLLIEEQRTNLVTYSEDLTAWHTFSGETSVTLSSDTIYGVSAYEVTGSTGGFGLGRLSPNGGTSINLTSDGVLTFWAKKITAGTTLQYLWNGSVIIFDSQVPNDGQWHKVEITLTAANSVLQLLRGFTSGTVALAMPQLEQGSFATSYIPTSGSQSTRSPDIASIPVSAFGYNQTAGTVVVEFSKMYPDAAYNRFHAGFGADASNYIGVGYASAQKAYVQPLVGAIDVLGASAPSPGEFATVAASFDASGATSAVDGQSNSATATGAAPAFSQSDTLYLGASAYSPSEIASGHIKSLSYFPRRLTDAQLQELTS